MAYTTLQKIRKLNAKHHALHVTLLRKLKDTLELIEEKRSRGLYSPEERNLLDATAKVIMASLALDERMNHLRTVLEKKEKVEKVLKD